MIFGLFGKRKEGQVEETPVGTAIHYFPKVKAVVVRVEKGSLSIGDRIKIKGHTTDIEQRISSMQIQHEPVKNVSRGQEVAIRIKGKARAGDHIFLLSNKK